ncbi:RDD family protein [Streptomyces nigrescens]|uniref:RDD family protein n=1 Tax=Streptomyces nigrescens TaxID=1920 RepID=UPI0034838454
MKELVTGEAVVLWLRPARLPSRGLAVAVDVAVAWVIYIGISLMLVSATSSMDGAAVAAVSVAAFVLVQVGIPIAVETLSQGRSLGKVICGLRVVREDGGPIRFRHALVRGAIGAIEIVMTMGVVAAIASLVSARGRRVGDVFAGTLVIRERMPEAETGTAMPAPPPWLVAELGALDLSRVPDGWWLTVRQYLARMGQLDPQVGGAMAGRLAEDLRGFTGVPAPAGVHPAAYLAAVAGERQARESQRAFGASGAAGPSAAVVGAASMGWGEGAAPGGWPGAGGGEARTGESWSSVEPMERAGETVTSGSGDVASVAGGAWASPGGGVGAPGGRVGAPGAVAGDGVMRGDGAASIGAPVREGAGDQGDGGDGRPPLTGFAPPV